jgi:hypothetical protein
MPGKLNKSFRVVKSTFDDFTMQTSFILSYLAISGKVKLNIKDQFNK